MAEVAAAKEEAEAVKKAHLVTLEQISGLTQEQAKQFLLKNVEEEVRHETAMKIKEIEQQMKDEDHTSYFEQIQCFFYVFQ